MNEARPTSDIPIQDPGPSASRTWVFHGGRRVAMHFDDVRCGVVWLLLAYNQAAFVGAAVRSALRQDLDDLVVVISDDASSDDTLGRILDAVAHTAHSKAVFVHRNEHNLGVARHLRARLHQYLDEVVILQGGDDFSALGRAREVVRLWRTEPGATLIASAYCEVDRRDAIRDRKTPAPIAGSDDALLAYLRSRTPVPIPGAIMALTRRQFDLFGFHDPGILWEDHVYYFRALLTGRVVASSQELVYYRRHSGSLSLLFSGPVKDRLDRWRKRCRRHRRRVVNLYRITHQNLEDLLVARDQGLLSDRRFLSLTGLVKAERERLFPDYAAYTAVGPRRVLRFVDVVRRVASRESTGEVLAQFVGERLALFLLDLRDSVEENAKRLLGMLRRVD